MILPIDDELQLDLLQERHAEELFALIEANRVHLREWLPWVDHETSVVDTKSFIRATLHQHEQNEGITTAVVFRQKLAGVVGLHKIDWTNRCATMGYWLGAEFQGQGIMTRACERMLEHSYTILKLHRIEIRCAVGNSRSCAIPRRLGFTWEGIAREAEWLNDHFVDLHIYSMLAPDWFNRSAG
jgi:ribosomal-protein-serine acetyltransferase